MIDIPGPVELIFVLGSSVIAMFSFVAATQHWLLIRNRWYETLALLLICFTLFRPGFWLDQISEPFIDRKSVVKGKSVSVRVVLGGRRSIKKKKNNKKLCK